MTNTEHVKGVVDASLLDILRDIEAGVTFSEIARRYELPYKIFYNYCARLKISRKRINELGVNEVAKQYRDRNYETREKRETLAGMDPELVHLNGIWEFSCSICRKKKTMLSPGEWAYKVKHKEVVYYACGYTDFKKLKAKIERVR
jgi:hypothetical protein